jgi:VWFA-related protein
VITRIAALLLGAAAFLARPLQGPTFTASVDAVRVDVAVTRDGRPVAGLTAGDFDVQDNGVPQDIRAFSLDSIPLTVVLAFDTSFSVRGRSLDDLKVAAHAAVAVLRTDDQVALLTFSHVLERPAAFSNDRNRLEAAIDRLVADGGTALNDAAFVALTLRRPIAGRNLILLFTDGIDTASWLPPMTVIEAARRADAVVDAVILNDSSRSNTSAPLPAQRRRWFLDHPQVFPEEFVPALADETGGEIMAATRGAGMRPALAQLLEAFRTRYMLTYSPANVNPTGWHRIDVRTRAVRATVKARRGYTRD